MRDLASVDVVMRLIWQTTLALVAIGLLLMVVLVVRRLLEEWQDARHRPAREQLRRSLLVSLNRPAAAAPGQPADLAVAETARLVDELAQIVRGDARRRLAAFAESAGVERHWLRRLRSRLTLYRVEAARCLALLATPKSRAALTACLEDQSPHLRLAAAEALAHDPTEASGLVARFTTDPAASGRSARRFWYRIATLAPNRLVERLVDANAVAALPSELAMRFVEALGDAGHSAAGGPIEALVGRHGDALDRTVLAALDRLEHPAVMRVARTLATAAESDSRRAAVAVLARRGRARDIDVVRNLAADPIADIGTTARAILARLAVAAAPGAEPA